MPNPSAISTLGDLRRAVERGEIRHRNVHEEVREYGMVVDPGCMITDRAPTNRADIT